MYDSSENILYKNAGPVWLAWLYMLRGNALKRSLSLEIFHFFIAVDHRKAS